MHQFRKWEKYIWNKHLFDIYISTTMLCADRSKLGWLKKSSFGFLNVFKISRCSRGDPNGAYCPHKVFKYSLKDEPIYTSLSVQNPASTEIFSQVACWQSRADRPHLCDWNKSGGAFCAKASFGKLHLHSRTDIKYGSGL